MVKIFSSMMAAIGRQLKQSVNVFQSLILYRRLPRRMQHVEHTNGDQNELRLRRGLEGTHIHRKSRKFC